MSGPKDDDSGLRRSDPKVRHLRYEPLRRRLQEIPYWPHRYRHKVIGKSTPQFEQSIEALQRKFPRLTREALGESKHGNYTAFTFELIAENVDEIIELWVESEQLDDYVKIL